MLGPLEGKHGSSGLWIHPQDLKDSGKQLFLHPMAALLPALLTLHASSLLVPTLSSLLILCALVTAS